MEIFSRRREVSVDNFTPIQINETIRVDDVKITAHNAGHILGSAQFQVQTALENVVYTGDINCADTLITNAAEILKCDTLIIEATYGHPAYVFPRREDTYVDIVKWTVSQIRAGRTPVFHLYSAGKAQEIIRLFNLLTRVTVVTHPVVSRVSAAYRSSGVKLDYLDAKTAEGSQVIKSGECVYVTPSNATFRDLRKASHAIVTGWVVRHKPRSVDAAFPLSSHADFLQLINHVREVKPKRVYTIYGFQDTLAELLHRKLKMDTRPIKTIGQKQLREFLWSGGS
jgi:putative mRNA 3-end processing factor